MAARKLTCFQVDVFTREKLSGNPAGVVLGADDLNEQEMQRIARELNNSETAFVLHPSGTDHDLHVRFFTPSCEVPSCGHATIAAHYVRSLHGNLPSESVRMLCGAGILQIDTERIADGNIKVFMHQARPQFAPFPGELKPRLLTALGIDENELDPRCPTEVVSTGHSKVLVGIENSEALNRLSPDARTLVEISHVTGVNGYFIFTLKPDNRDFLSEARMFAPAIGIREDPVTGNGNGPLGAYFVKHRLAGPDDGTLDFCSLQGRAMGRPGTVRVVVEVRQGQPQTVKVGQDAVIAFQFELTL